MQPVSGATQSGALSTFGGVPRAVCRDAPHAYTYTYGICAACVCVGNTVAHKYLKHANISTDTLRIQTVRIKHIREDIL